MLLGSQVHCQSPRMPSLWQKEQCRRQQGGPAVWKTHSWRIVGSLFVSAAEVSLSKAPRPGGTCVFVWKRRHETWNLVYFFVLHNYCTNTCEETSSMRNGFTHGCSSSLLNEGTSCPKALPVKLWWNNHRALSSTGDLPNKNKHLCHRKPINVYQLVGTIQFKKGL